MAPVQIPGARKLQSLSEEIAERKQALSLLSGFFHPLQAALDAGDVIALQAAVQGLTKKEAATLIFHNRQLWQAREWGSEARILRYARETWGLEPPSTVVSGTRKVRIAGLLAQSGESLSLDDARAVVAERMAEELADLAEGYDSGSVFWRFPPSEPNDNDARRAATLLKARERARLDALLSYCDTPLRQAHAAALQALEGTSSPSSCWLQWHKAGRAVQTAPVAGEAA